MIFLDQPVQVGYSYTEGPAVVTTADASKDVYAFLQLFMKSFPEYSALEFNIAGESYAGHYIPKSAPTETCSMFAQLMHIILQLRQLHF